MNYEERLQMSYQHVSEEFPEEFIKNLHRTAEGRGRRLVRHPDADGMPYILTCWRKWLDDMSAAVDQFGLQEAAEALPGDDYQLLSYYYKHWRKASAPIK